MRGAATAEGGGYFKLTNVKSITPNLGQGGRRRIRRIRVQSLIHATLNTRDEIPRPGGPRPWFGNGEERLVQPPLPAFKRIEIGSVVVPEGVSAGTSGARQEAKMSPARRRVNPTRPNNTKPEPNIAS